MKNWNFKWSLSAVFALYSLTVFFWGETGLGAMRNQREVQSRLRGNISRLLSINAALNRELDSYRSSPETIMIQARNLGYLDEGEKLLFIDDLVSEGEMKSPGKVILPEAPPASPEGFFRISAILLALMILGSAGIRRFKSRQSGSTPPRP